MRYRFILAALLGLCAQITVLAAAAPPLVLEGPPWSPYLDAEHPRKGFATEIVLEALNRAGIEAQVLIKPWPRVFAEAQNGVAQGLVGLWASPERANLFHFSRPYYINRIHLVKRQDRHFEFRGRESLMGHRIGVRQSASYGRSFDNMEGLQRIEMNDLPTILRMTVARRLDLGVGDRLLVREWIKAHPVEGGQLMLVEPPVSEISLHLAISQRVPDHEAVVMAFNQALESMIRDGTLLQIYRRWDVSLEPQRLLDPEFTPQYPGLEPGLEQPSGSGQ